MIGRKLLIPFNFTLQDRKALEFVSQNFAGQEDIEITLFHAYTPVPEIEAVESMVTGKLRGNLSYLNQKVLEKESALEKIESELASSSSAAGRVRHVFRARKKEVAAEIIDAVNGERFNIVVLNRKPNKVSRFFSASVHQKVIAACKGATVCIVS